MADFSFFFDSLLILLIALLIDSVFGEVPDKMHPTVWMGNVIAFLKPRILDPNPLNEKIKGTLMALFVIISFAVPTYLIVLWTKQLAGWIPYVIVAAIILKMSFARKCMSQYTVSIAHAIEKGDLERAKRLLPYIVRRDPSTLSQQHIISAAVESIAESSTDGINSPFFYFALFGIPGAIAYRAINTLDSMVGYRDKKHVNIGWFSANVDKIANYIPARLTAALIVVSARILRENWRDSLRIIRRDRRRMESANAGWTIAAMAGALSTQLEKPGFYRLGDCNGLTPGHIERALRIMNLVALLFCMTVVFPILFLKTFFIGALWV